MDTLVQTRPAGGRAPFDERTRLLAAVLREPGCRDALTRLGEHADRTADWPAAEWCWRRRLLIDDRAWQPHAGLAAALTGQGRSVAAERTLAAAWVLLPGEVEIGGRFARLAEARADWPEALRRWQAVLLACGHRPDGYLGLASAMRGMGRPDEARRVLEQGAARFPAEPLLPHDLARLAEERRDWPEAERRWRQTLELRQDCPGVAALARALFFQDRGADAAAELDRHAPVILRAEPEWLAFTAIVMGENWSPAMGPLMLGLERALEPHAGEGASHPVALAYARAAKLRGDLRSFRERADAMGRRFEGDVLARQLTLEARELAPEDGDGWREDAGEGDDFARFESLGGGGVRGGCEFGFVQRGRGLEPLSLLRWASIEPDALADALERRFEGLGEPGTVEVEAQSQNDWRAVDAVYGVRMDHTHLDRGAVDAAAAVRQVSTRLRFLRRKLLGDLAEADKVFVYRMAGRGVPRDLLLRFSRALASYGDGLLVVVCEDGPGPETEFSDVAPNLLLARHEGFGGPAPRTVEEATPTWRAICARGLDWQRSRRSLASAAEAASRFEGLGDGLSAEG